jgi:hypothetical protein
VVRIKSNPDREFWLEQQKFGGQMLVRDGNPFKVWEAMYGK